MEEDSWLKGGGYNRTSLQQEFERNLREVELMKARAEYERTRRINPTDELHRHINHLERRIDEVLDFVKFAAEYSPTTFAAYQQHQKVRDKINAGVRG